MIQKTHGLVLAGGRARRMGGGDKLRIKIGGVTIPDRVLARMTPDESVKHRRKAAVHDD